MCVRALDIIPRYSVWYRGSMLGVCRVCAYMLLFSRGEVCLPSGHAERG